MARKLKVLAGAHLTCLYGWNHKIEQSLQKQRLRVFSITFDIERKPWASRTPILNFWEKQLFLNSISKIR